MHTIGDLERIRRHHAAAAEGARLEARRAGLEVGERLRAALGVPADATKAGRREECELGNLQTCAGLLWFGDFHKLDLLLRRERHVERQLWWHH
jgi:hypothetical protein